jgi:hypothetical protein
MGCDIHLHIEVKINGTWHHWGAPDIKRSYTLFALMAGVRSYDDIKPIVEPRGLPEDLTELTRIDYENWYGGCHTPSWLTAEEMEQVFEQYQSICGARNPKEKYPLISLEHNILHTYLFGNGFSTPNKYPSDNQEDVQDVRFVFWFDN